MEGYLRQFVTVNYHLAGTCAMMSEELDGIVNEPLIVYERANVRVCDVIVILILLGEVF